MARSNPDVERVIGSIRGEHLDHVIIFNERHLRRVLPPNLEYYHRTRTHLSLDKDCSDPRPIMPCKIGKVVAFRKLAACITATNASPPDSQPLFANGSMRADSSRVISGFLYCLVILDLHRGRPYEIERTARPFYLSSQFARNADCCSNLPAL